MHPAAVGGVFDEVDEVAGRESLTAQHGAGTDRDSDVVDPGLVEADRGRLDETDRELLNLAADVLVDIRRVADPAVADRVDAAT